MLEENQEHFLNMGIPSIKKGIAPCRHKRKQYKNYKNQARITIKYKKYRDLRKNKKQDHKPYKHNKKTTYNNPQVIRVGNQDILRGIVELRIKQMSWISVNI